MYAVPKLQAQCGYTIGIRAGQGTDHMQRHAYACNIDRAVGLRKVASWNIAILHISGGFDRVLKNRGCGLFNTTKMQQLRTRPAGLRAFSKIVEIVTDNFNRLLTGFKHFLDGVWYIIQNERSHTALPWTMYRIMMEDL